MRNLLATTTALTLVLTAAVLLLSIATQAEPTCCQEKGLFDLPKVDLTQPKPPEGCKKALDRAMEILPEVEKEIEDPLKAAMREAVASREKDETPAEGWDSAASLALLNLHPAASLWAELNAIKAEWRSDFLVQAGVYLALLQKNDDAKLMLHCAYDDGNRSPYLLEALANLYRNAGDKPNAVRFIGEAQTAAPDDPLIQLEKQSFNSGAPPQRPVQPTDPVEAAISDLKAHIDSQLAAVKRGEELRARVEKAFYGQSHDDPQKIVDDLRKAYNQTLASLDPLKPNAKLTPAQFKQKFPGSPDSLRTELRNAFFYSAIVAYLSVTDNMLQAPRPAEVDEGFDVGFWSQVIGLEPVHYASAIKSLHDFEYEGIKRMVPGYYFEDWEGAYFGTFYDYAWKKRGEGHDDCARAHQGDLDGENACKLEVDKKFCATIRQLHKSWMDGTEALVQRLGRRFDGVASGVLVQAGEVAADAFSFASKYSKQMNVAPTDATGQGYVRDLNEKYREVVARAVGAGDGGPAALARNQEQTYLLYKDRAQTEIAQYKQTIEETCQPVDARALQQLIEEHRKAVSDMLLDRLIRDLNVAWNPNADCTFSMGKWISISVDIDGNVKTKGKWSPYLKAFQGSPTFDINKNFKFDIKDARYLVLTAGVDKTQSGGPFTGKGSMNVGISYDTKTGSVSLPVEMSTKLGVGFTKKVGGQDVGVSCYPGELKAKFDARVVAKDVMDYVSSLN